MILKYIYIILLGVAVMGNTGCSNESDALISAVDNPSEIMHTVESKIPWNAPPLENAPSEEIILEKLNNTTSVHELVTTTYPKETLLGYYTRYICMVNVDIECKIECIREIGKDRYYTVHKSDDGGILYSLFSRSKDGFLKVGSDNTNTILTNWYVSREVRKSDFENLKVNFSTVNDVKQIDPYGFYPVDLAPYRGMVLEFETSMHLTTDGYQVIITYLWEDADKFVVTDVKIEEASENSFYQQLLLMDRPENLL